ncbi:MAG: VWA domain-containing protein [Lentisphaerae bacterium]|nr:VWA domain-containing protein [Lentisphaerota bacterium]
MQIQFVNPWMLVGLWLAPAFAFIWLAAWRLKAKALARFLSPTMGQKLSPPPQTARFYWQWLLILLGFLLALIAAARPQWGLRTETVLQRGRDLVIALDVSRSMLAQDVHPNRMQRAKTDIQDLLRELRGDRAALIAFRGKAIGLCPLTTDYAYLEQVLADVSPESAPRGETDIGDAIAKALDAFESDAGAYQAIILISDGEDLAGQSKTMAETARKKGVAVFTVGLGDPQGAKIPSSARPHDFMTYQGQEVVTRLQHETLKTIAEITGGAYVPVGTANVKLGALYRDHLSKLAARDLAESIQRRYIERYQFFLLPAVLAFLAGALLSKGRLGIKKKPPEAVENRLWLSQRLRPSFENAIFFGRALSPRAPRTAQRAVPTTERPGRPTGKMFNTNLTHFRKKNPTAAWAAPVAGAARAVFLLLALTAVLAVDKLQAQTLTAVPATNRLAPDRTNLQSMSGALTNQAPVKSTPTGRAGARHAQQLYWLGKYAEAAKAYLQAAQGQTPTLQNDCIFNAACALYRAGQYQAAAEKFGELALAPADDSAAASYNSGCAAFQLAEQSRSAGTNLPPDTQPKMLERAGQAFQRALRLETQDEAARANLGVVTNVLSTAREQAKIRALLERWQGAHPAQLADNMLINQRALLEGLRAALTNSRPSRLDQIESLSRAQQANTDLLIPLKAELAGAEQRQVPAATSAAPPAGQVEAHMEALRTVMQQTTESLRNLEPDAYREAATAEAGIYTLWKALADFPQLLREDIFRQTNTIAMTTSVLTRAAEVELPAIRHQQSEAQALTRLFGERFAQAVPPEGTSPVMAGMLATNQAPGNTGTNAPEDSQEITPATRTNILALAQEASALQSQAIKSIEGTNLAAALPAEQQALKLLEEIEKLLPKNKDQQPQDQSQNQQPEDSPQDQKQEQKQQQPQPQQEKPQEQPQESAPQPPEQPQTPEEPQPQEADKDKTMTPEQARALLEKAQQRAKEHREQRSADTYIPPSPVDKDW